MLAGAMAPELGGHPTYLDIVGVNFITPTVGTPGCPAPLGGHAARSAMGAVAVCYWPEVVLPVRRPVVISETSHFGAGRGRWIREVGEEVARAREAGVRVEGLCIYPIIDRPDWDDPAPLAQQRALGSASDRGRTTRAGALRGIRGRAPASSGSLSGPYSSLTSLPHTSGSAQESVAGVD